MTENKPALSVQAATVDMGDVQKAEYKQTLFWGLWEKLSLHNRIVGTRTDATLNGCGFLKVGWDPEAGIEIPSTRKRVKYVDVDLPATDPATGEPLPPDPVTGAPATTPEQVYAGIEEYYIDKDGNDLGPVESKVDDEDNPGEKKTVRNPVPDGCDMYCEGEVFVDERRAANIRWDRYVDDIDESWYVQDSEVMPGFKIVSDLRRGRARCAERCVAGDGRRSTAVPLGAPVARSSRERRLERSILQAAELRGEVRPARRRVRRARDLDLSRRRRS
jgi:hypothetical protein